MSTPYKGKNAVVLLDIGVDEYSVRCGKAINADAGVSFTTADETFESPQIDIPNTPKPSFKIPCNDTLDHAAYDKAKALADAGVPCAVAYYPCGNVAGQKRIAGNAYVSCSGLSVAVNGVATFEITVNFTAAPTDGPNMVLASHALTAVGQGDAYSGVNLVASGGTSTYTYALVGASAAFPVQGVTMSSGGVIGGTANAAAPIGTHYFFVRVTDSATPANTKDFLCSIEVVA